MQRARQRPDGRRQGCATVGAGRRDDACGEGRRIEPVLGRTDPVRVDRLDAFGSASPRHRRRNFSAAVLPPRDDVVRHRVGMPVGDAGRTRDDAHHLRREPAEILARLLVGDLVQLAELPLAGEPCRLGLEVGRRVSGQLGGLVRFRRPASPSRGRRRRGGPRRSRTGSDRRDPRCRRRGSGGRRPRGPAPRSPSRRRRRPRDRA